MAMVKDLGKYTTECGFIYLNSLLRGSILYGAEAMINTKEEDFRKIEQIEEQQMRLLFQTNKSCPLHLLYLESGQAPARFEIKRMAINFYQYILQQKEDSLLNRMLSAQKENPVKNDFYQSVNLYIQEFGISSTDEEIRSMKPMPFKKIVKEKSKEAAFQYLSDKQSAGKKGKYIKYFGLTMAEYLLPEANLSIEEQREVFSIRCRTNPLPANRGITEYCTTQCGEILDNSHIFKCNNLNEPGHEFEIDKVLNGFTSEIKSHLEIWRRNIAKLNEITSGTSSETVCH